MANHHEPVSARFWLLDASDNLQLRSHREPDDYGIDWFDEQGRPRMHRDPQAPGELLHVNAAGEPSVELLLPDPPAIRLTLDDLGETAVRSQAN